MLFDTGQDRASVTDPGYFPGGVKRVLYDRLARFEIGPDETLSAGLDQLGYAVGDVRTAVLSHLHQDHIGGLAELSQADIVVSQAEWDTLSAPLPEMRGLMRRHIDLPGLRWHKIDGQNPPATPALPRSCRAMTCSVTAASSCCPPPGTRPARCRCWCADRAGRR